MIDIVVNTTPTYITVTQQATPNINIKYGSVDSVNGKNGVVVLDANDVGADPLGAAAIAEQSAKDYADTVRFPRVTSITSSATPTPNVDTTDQLNIIALAVDAVFGAPTGTPTDGQEIVYRYKDDGTARAISMNAVFVDLTGNMPATTTVGVVGVFTARYSTVSSKWEIVDVVGESTDTRIYSGGFGSTDLASNVNYHTGWNNLINPAGTSLTRKLKFLRDEKIIKFGIDLHYSIAGSAETVPIYLRNITASMDTLLLNVTLNGATGSYNNFVSGDLNIDVLSTSEYSIKFGIPTMATNAVGVTCSFRIMTQ